MTWTEGSAGADLVAQGLRKSSVLWLTLPTWPAPRIAWHVWHEGAAWLVHEGAEQTLPGLDRARTAQVWVRATDGRLLARWPARVESVGPDDPRWPAAAAALNAHRQSPPDGDAQTARWAAQSHLTRLVPLTEPAEAG